MVVDAVIVVAGALAFFQARPDRIGQQVRRRGHLGDEAAPARQGGQLQVPGLAGGIALRLRAGGDGHHRLSASANGSKIGIGITFASAIPYAWVSQTGEGGRIVLPYSGPHHPSGLAVLTVRDGIGSGRIIDDNAWFMPMKGQGIS